MTGGSFWRAFGPGVLFAGAAVGVSHLVQSTRAGAEFGFALLIVVVLANLAKYPAFRFGPQYAAATGVSLLEGYRRQGRWALALYALLTAGTMFTVLAAVTLVTAALAIALFGLHMQATVVCGGILALCAAVIGVGRFKWLDLVTKGVVAVLTVSTLVATALALTRANWGAIEFSPADIEYDRPTVFFIAALVGWMPSAIDVSVWQSLWTLAKRRATGHAPSMRESMLDFHIGYIGTAVLALCFVTLGAAVMSGKGIAFADGAGPFANQVIALYTTTLGDWSRPIIGAAALSVMMSTTLTVVDGFPRAIAVLVSRFRGPETSDAGDPIDGRGERAVYWGALAVLVAGALIIIALLLKDFRTLIDVATVLSFLTAPALSLLNHRAITSTDVPTDRRPGAGLVIASWLGIAFQAAVAIYYLYLRFG